jgi:hypothetical protein
LWEKTSLINIIKRSIGPNFKSDSRNFFTRCLDTLFPENSGEIQGV